MKTKNIIFYLIGLFVFSACDDMFEPADENNRQLEDLVEESKYAHGLLMYAYDRLPYQTTTVTDIATDDAVTNLKTSTYLNMATGSWASDNNPMSQWDACKDGIQYINMFLSIVNDVKWAPSAASKQQMFVDRLKGEAYGLRALLYYYLLMAHGGYADDGQLLGVPLLTQAEDGSSEFNQPRASFADCVKQIYSDCDAAMSLLPLDYKDITSEDDIPQTYKDMGAIVSSYNLVFGLKAKNLMSARVAEAVKAQTALLAASPAFRDQSGVTSAEAADLCAKVLDRVNWELDPTGNIWYKTLKTDPQKVDIPEILWREDFHDKDCDQEAENFPPTVDGHGRVNPSQNLVDAFPMRSGLPITDASAGYNNQDPYTNRDPRLAHYVLYNGTKLRSSDIVTGTYPNADGISTDNLEKGSESTRTGYYLMKLLRTDVNPNSSSTTKQYHCFARIRYTEIFLAYAEAANDAWGPKGDGGHGHTAYEIIKAIRERAGLATNEVGMPLPEGDTYLENCANDKDKMTNLIRNERRIELCFENKRFWDLRRWKMTLNETVKGVRIDKIDADKDPTADNLKYTYFDVENRNYDNSYQCYGPIPKSEILKFSALMQNKGW